MYGLAALVILLAQTLRSSRATAIEALGSAEHLALYDTLTDLPNRVLFNDRVGQALAAAARDGTGIALLLIDLDPLQGGDDTFGHHVGDVLLKEVGPHPGVTRSAGCWHPRTSSRSRSGARSSPR